METYKYYNVIKLVAYDSKHIIKINVSAGKKSQQTFSTILQYKK